jgi:eukaryotic-like serine/threonine-protein kinase
MTERDIFIAALQKEDPAQRQASLDEACAGQPELRQQVEHLLRLYDGAASFLEKPAVDSAATGADHNATEQAPDETPGAVIGPYKLLQKIGEGGMGTVYMAEQTHPVQRKVALKVIKPGMDSRQVIARFEAERQALALMDHVNIARVLDGGSTDTGRPYFVMELVHGVPITQYCDDNHLTPRERLELFVPVCQAIQHAHQKGIIHRDIKPSNVMVTLYDGKPVPKVIDFGVAKATEQKLTERTLFTQYGTMVGTLEYMSPEQAEMSALGVDTRSDIYSLGVLLYELLTGSTPLTHKRLKEAAYGEILRLIKEEEPPRPSTRLSDSGEALASISAQRHMEPAKLSRLMRGELDWIVMKCLEKDRNRRYETANGFAADVQRYLCGEAVQAVPPSVGYRFRKFARRNKAPLAFTGLVLLILLTVTAGIGWNVRDRTARQTAVQQEVKLALKEAEEWQEQGKWPEARSAAKRAEGLVAGGGSDELRERVHQLRKDLNMVLRLDDIRLRSSEWKDNKFDFESADQACAQAFADYGIDVARLSANEAAARIRGRPGVAKALAAALDDWAFSRSRKDKAGSLALTAVAQSADPDPWRRQVREAVKKKDGKALEALAASPELLRQSPASLIMLARALRVHNLVETRIEVLRKAQRQYPGDFWINLELASTLGPLGPSHMDDAVSFGRAALAVRPQSATAHYSLGNLLGLSSPDSIACYRKAIELDPKFAYAYINLAIGLTLQGNRNEAIACFRKAIEIDPQSNVIAHIYLGGLLLEQGKPDEAIACYRKAIELNPKPAQTHYGLGNALRAQGKLDEAIACYRKAIELNPRFADAYTNLGAVLYDQKRLEEAIANYGKAIEIDPKHAKAHNNLANAVIAQGKVDEAVTYYRKSVELNPKEPLTYYNLGNALRKQKKLDEAIACYQKAIDLDPKFAYAQSLLDKALKARRTIDEATKAIELKPKDWSSWNQRAWAYFQQQRWDEAVADYSKAIELNPNVHTTWFHRGHAHMALKKWDEVVVDYSELLKKFPGDANAYHYRGWAHENRSRWSQASADYGKAIELAPKNDTAHHRLAWLLATCPDAKVRDPGRAVELARKAVQLEPKQGFYWQTLGYAEYRAGNWKSAIAALEKVKALGSPGDSLEWYPLAMAHWRLGHKEEARTWYDQAVAWMEKNQPKNEELRRLQAEAAELLGIEKKKD